MPDLKTGFASWRAGLRRASLFIALAMAGAPAAIADELPKTVDEFMQVYDQFLSMSGAGAAAPHQLVVPACGNCVPVVINCTAPIDAPSGLVGRRTIVDEFTVTWAKGFGGVPVADMQTGGLQNVVNVIQSGAFDCIVAGNSPLG